MPLIISENGMANVDFISEDGKIHDPQRISFIEKYLSQLTKAKEEGVPIQGYFYWSFMDNFEWAEGYEPRFGLVYVDYKTQNRYKKDSFYYYQDIVKKDL